jgi:hypothetical protein
VGATDAKLVGGAGASDAERVNPRREAILDGEEVVEATGEPEGDADDPNVLDKPVSADAAEDAVDAEEVVRK